MLLGDLMLLGVIALIVACFIGLIAVALCGMAGMVSREDEERARFTRFDWQQRGWFS